MQNDKTNEKKISSLDINNEFLNNLSHISNKYSLVFETVDEDEKTYLEKITLLVQKLISLHKNNNLVIRINSLKDLEDSNLLNLLDKYCFVKINFKLTTFTYADFIIFRYQLKKFLKPIILANQKYNLSSLELFLLIYDRVCNFKPYISYPENYPITKRGSLKYLFTSKYTVCSDYSILLVASLSYFGISANRFNITIDEYKNNELEISRHARVLLKLVDPKYNVKGIFVSDPTWDHKSIFVHALMPIRLTTMEEDLQRLNIIDYFLDVTSFDEFISRVNVLLRKGKSPEFIYNVVMNILVNIDINYYLEIKNKFTSNEFNFSEFIKDIGNYFIKYSNQEVSLELLCQTILNIQCKLHNKNLNEYQNKLNKLIEQNIISYQSYFQDNWPYDMEHKSVR